MKMIRVPHGAGIAPKSRSEAVCSNRFRFDSILASYVARHYPEFVPARFPMESDPRHSMGIDRSIADDLGAHAGARCRPLRRFTNLTRELVFPLALCSIAQFRFRFNGWE